MVKQAAQERPHLQSTAQVLGDLQNHLQFVGRVLTQERGAGRCSADLSADDLIGQRQGIGRCRRIGTQVQDIRADLQGVALGQTRRAVDAPPVDEGAVAAADIFNKVFTAVAEDAGVLTAYRQRFQNDGGIFLAADKQTIARQREALAGIGTFDRHQRRHASLLPRRAGICQPRRVKLPARSAPPQLSVRSASKAPHYFFSDGCSVRGGGGGAGLSSSTTRVGGWPKATNNWN